MSYYLLTGDKKGSPEKFKNFLGKEIDNHTPQDAILDSEVIRLNALEDFEAFAISGFAPAYKDEPRGVVAINAEKFKDTFTAARMVFSGVAGIYDVSIKSLKELDGESTYRLLIGEKLGGSFQNPTTKKDYAPYIHKSGNIAVAKDSVIQVESNSASNGLVPEGKAFVFSRGR